MRRAAITIVLALIALYFGDYLAARNRPLGSVEIERMYSVPIKGGKTEFFPPERETEACVHSLLPHLGDRPCWYASRHKQKRINM